jgi:hypothetical protein
MINQERYNYTILKWRYIVNNNGSEDGLIEAYPELLNFNSYCSYCEFFICKGCVGCPLNLLKEKYPVYRMTDMVTCACREVSHPFNVWVYNKNTKNAQAVFNLIIKTKPEI